MSPARIRFGVATSAVTAPSCSSLCASASVATLSLGFDASPSFLAATCISQTVTCLSFWEAVANVPEHLRISPSRAARCTAAAPSNATFFITAESMALSTSSVGRTYSPSSITAMDWKPAAEGVGVRHMTQVVGK